VQCRFLKNQYSLHADLNFSAHQLSFISLRINISTRSNKICATIYLYLERL